MNETGSGARETSFLKKKFSEHYSRSLPVPPALAQRELGFGWEKKIDYRHKAFASPGEFRSFMVSEAPLFVSYSTAYYEFPGARPMEKKGYLGSDVVFDIDIQHTEEPHAHNSLICPACIERAKEDALRLAEDFLCSDFGFSQKEVSVNYSGSKGFHLHVLSDAVRQLPASARAQLADYVAAQGLDAARLVTGAGDKTREKGAAREAIRGPGSKSRGWGKKIFDYCAGFVSGASLESFKEAGLTRKEAERIVSEKEFVLKKMREGNWDAVAGLDKLWKKAVADAVAAEKVVVDRSVTIDQARLIRLPDSIHGDTGLVAKKCDLKRFNPLTDAVAFPEGLARVRAEEDLFVPILGKAIEVRANVPTDVPLAAAVLLLCKKKAVLVQEY
ncbi:MAG: DNA primase catalytic subunit PriS [Candidatus Micrarchaeota archaeon]|nr:DNA primase catalytic subunit PriS [Candidatus Micrarchaeota archaeon]